jgi:hypothetical protein
MTSSIGDEGSVPPNRRCRGSARRHGRPQSTCPQVQRLRTTLAGPFAGAAEEHAMKKQGQQRPAKAADVAHTRAEQRNQKQNRAVQLAAANVEETPKMDPGDGAVGTEPPVTRPADVPRRGAVDTQGGTPSAGKPAKSGRTSSGGSGASQGADRDVPNPGPSEASSGADRDTMTGPRPGGRS